MTATCKACGLVTDEDEHYLFCNTECQDLHYRLKERRMKDRYEMDPELYEAWLTGRRQAIEDMKTIEQIEERIIEVAKIKFLANREWAMLHDRSEAISGRKRIPTWLREDRDKLITDPTISVDWKGDPRKIPKEKKPKQDLAQEFFGINVKEAMRELKSKPKDEGPKIGRPKKEDTMAILMAPTEPVKLKATAEEIKAKADALKEKLRLAKEGKK